MNSLISVLSGDIWDDGGIWRTKDGDNRSGGAGATESFRIPAAAVLAQEDPRAVIVLQGGLAQGLRPSLASVMSQELSALGVSAESLVLEERSQTTYQQLVELQSLAKRERPAQVWILSNEWHLPRIEAMLENIPALAALQALRPHLVSAEEVLLRTGSAQWGDAIAAARQSAPTRARIALEQEGIEDLKAGRYHFH